MLIVFTVGLVNKKIIIHYKKQNRIQHECYATYCMLVVNPVRVDNFASTFNCTPAGRTSDLMIAPA